MVYKVYATYICCMIFIHHMNTLDVLKNIYMTTQESIGFVRLFPCINSSVTGDWQGGITCTSWLRVTNQHQAMRWCRTQRNNGKRTWRASCKLESPGVKDNSHRRRWGWLKSFHSVCFEVPHHCMAWCSFVTRRHNVQVVPPWQSLVTQTLLPSTVSRVFCQTSCQRPTQVLLKNLIWKGWECQMETIDILGREETWNRWEY